MKTFEESLDYQTSLLSQIRDIYDIVSVYVHVSFFYREKQTKSFKEGLVDGKEPPGHGWTGQRVIIIGGS